MVNFERNPEYKGHNITVDSERFYRGLTADSYEDLWQTDADGAVVMKGHGKGGTDRLSFQKSYPNDLYVNGLVKANTIIEGDPRMPIQHVEEGSGYAFVDRIERDKVESGEIPLKVHQRRVVGGQAIESNHVWETIFDSFPSK